MNLKPSSTKYAGFFVSPIFTKKLLRQKAKGSTSIETAEVGFLFGCRVVALAR